MVDGPFGSNLKTEHYTETGPRVVRLQNIGDGEFLDAEAHISQEHFDSLRKHNVLPGDVLIASLGETLPRACVAPAWLGDAIVKADCLRVRPAPGVDPRFVAAVLNSPDIRSKVSAQIQGVGRPRVNLSTLRSLEVPVPPEKEQCRIVEELQRRMSRVDRAMESLRTSLSKLAPARRAICGFAVRPTAGNAGADASYLARLSAEIGHDVAPIADAGWPVVRLGDLVLRIEAGKSFACDGRPAAPEEWGVVKVSSMSWGDFLEEENKALPERAVPNPDHEIKKGDLLFSRANTSGLVGASVLVGNCRPRLVLSDKSLRLIPAPSVDRQWLQFALSAPSVRAQMSELASGVKDSMRNISQEKLRSIAIPLPTLEFQLSLAVEIERRLSLVDVVSRGVSANVRKTEAVRRSLRAAAFSGRLVPQDPSDEPADQLLERIRSARAEAESPKRRGRTRATRSEAPAA